MVSVGVTLAATKYPGFETNVVVIGQIKIGLIDRYYEIQDNYSTQHYSEANPPAFNPGDTVKKEIAVENTGKFDCYVRILLRREWQINETTDFSNYITIIEKDTTKWYHGSNVYYDGVEYECYYYRHILPAGETTPLLCEKFKLGDFDKTTAGTKTGKIIVLAQAVQSDYVDVGDLSQATTPEEIAEAESKTIVKNIDHGVLHIVKWNGLEFKQIGL